jgi:hypothetical protein
VRKGYDSGMSSFGGLGLTPHRASRFEEPRISYVLLQRPLHRVLNFTGHSIDDVVNNPIVKNKVLGFYKLHRFVHRRCEIVDLERQWNALGQ